MKENLENTAKQLVIENLKLACSELMRYQSGSGISDSSLLHRIYAVCCRYKDKEDAIEETFRLISEAAVCVIAGSDSIQANKVTEIMQNGLREAFQTPKSIQ